jgi:hypothetical protein
MVKTITRKTKGKAKEKSQDGGCARTKEKERARPSRGRKLFHP